MKRILIGGIFVVLVAIAAAILYLGSNLDAIVARAIERSGSQILGTEVSVGSVEISLREGRGTIRRLRVANPPGFSSNDAISIGEFTLRIDAGSVTSNPIVVPEVRVGAPVVRFELNQKAQSNMDVLQRNAESFAPSGSGTSAPEPEATRLRIGTLSMDKGVVHLDLGAVNSKGETRSANLPPLALSNLGGKSGASPGEIGKRVAVVLTSQIAQTVAREGVNSVVQKELGRLGEGAAEAARGVFDRLGGAKD